MMSSMSLSRMLRAASVCRTMSTATKLTAVEVNDKTGIATVTLSRPPINALNVELLHDLYQSIKEIENNKSRGLILTSSNDKVFSAGLDINEMYRPDKDRARLLWTKLQDVWLALYGCALPTAAAINGHAPAGGCLLATSCEYRVILPQCRIGLNEIQLGLVPPIFCMFNFLNVLPRRVAERALVQGRIFTTEQALQIGLVDDVASSKEKALEKCSQFIATFAQTNPLARSLTKLKFRGADLQRFESERTNELESFLEFIDHPQMQEDLGIYLEGLKKKNRN
ncbi:PREDICTED: enoyl-CoA delta isomerase 1, mitochondrial-like [Drosophila arizonae]|uniref:Enoyl-CoA delta isomerase 1, mitochondrial-like n=1 Tax=Drosophila arizonae TaxID=7263 RepID=A0ABM1NV13_DROAR|nr:PREDICTED: enoyl-CoA delta isomerase 1, mitochondrial-like [Drosophila arizonae]XP_017858798.1 PREDICTED: enoyl-CoA delta isomerase 1, mitochondrial-like [Drosophila arizonae]XP_017858799.1 PREDICTED: enoyl-CoA delta isomerase 1, mitochondrial-like [Drosophila arizonae]